MESTESESQVQVPVSTDASADGTPVVAVQASKRLDEQGSAPMRPSAPKFVLDEKVTTTARPSLDTTALCI